MTSGAIKRWVRVAVLVSCGAWAAPAATQMVQRVPTTNPADPANTLSAYLRTLAASPRDLNALLGAGQAALDVGDPNAALGFFARAEEIQPSNGRVKAGLASALVLLEKPDDALKLFGQAIALGVPESAVVADRGLAYDLRGDNRRAQADYEAALRRGPDDEVTRRYALSLGISGDKAKAMAVLDPLLRRQDQGAWRARAFILAMNGDLAGANIIARQVMAASLATTMSPFLSRLAKLNPAERAHAVNFGTVPADGQTFASVQMGDPYGAGSPVAASENAGSILIPAGAPLGRRPPVAQPVVPSSLVATRSTARVDTRITSRIAAIDRSKLPATVTPGFTATQLPLKTLPPPSSPGVTTTGPVGSPHDAIQRPGIAATSSAAMPFEVSTAPKPAPAVAAVAPMSRLASILAGIEPEAETAPVALPEASVVRAQQRAAARKIADAAAAAKTAKALKDEKAKELAAARANPPRLWVQVATGSNASALATTWKRIRDANAAVLKGYAGYSTPFKASNRVLAGPVKTAADVRKLVNALAKGGVSATTYSSEAGQEILKLAVK